MRAASDSIAPDQTFFGRKFRDIDATSDHNLLDSAHIFPPGQTPGVGF